MYAEQPADIELFDLVQGGQTVAENLPRAVAMRSVAHSRGVACCDNPKPKKMGDGWWWCLSCGARWKQ